MKLNIISIGNSKGIRLPKNLISQCNIKKEVNVEIEDGKLVITPVKTEARKNWSIKFREMHKNKDDKQILSDRVNSRNTGRIN